MTVWITTSETATERTQRKVKAVRVEGGLAVTPAPSLSGACYCVTHLATGRRLTPPYRKAYALELLTELLKISDWTVERPQYSLEDIRRLGLV